MKEEDIRNVLQSMEIPVTVEIPNAIIISKDLMRKSLAVVGGYVILRKAVYVYAKLYMDKVKKEQS